MDNNIKMTVYNVLKDGTEKISESVSKLDKLEEKIKSGRYSGGTLRSEIYPARDRLKARIRDDSAEIIRAAKGLVSEYRADVERMNDLDPAEITDDIKLLQSGIPLLPRDIQAILRRNTNNRTMVQLALRYAQEHSIDTGGTYYIGGEAERENGKNLDALVDLYAERITQSNAGTLLNKFFDMEG